MFCCLVMSSHNGNWPSICLGPKIQPSFLPVTEKLNGTEDTGKDLLL